MLDQPSSCLSSSNIGWVRRDIAALSIILTCGMVLRMYQLPTRTIWLDESLSWRLSNFRSVKC